MTLGHVIGITYVVIMGLCIFIGVTHNQYHDNCKADCYLTD